MSASAIRAAMACGHSSCACGRRSDKVHCPVHDPAKGGRPDLSVTDAVGRPLVFCHVCGKAGQDALVAELKARGLWPREDSRTETPRVETGRTSWTIRDAVGAVQAIHERIDYSDGSKHFTWRRPDGRAGLDGRKSATLPLYGSELLTNVPAGSAVVVCEGEKAADAARTLDIPAVGTVTGAGNPIHDDAALRVLLPFRVVLWPDNDTKGHAHMVQIARRLVALGMTE